MKAKWLEGNEEHHGFEYFSQANTCNINNNNMVLYEFVPFMVSQTVEGEERQS